MQNDDTNEQLLQVDGQRSQVCLKKGELQPETDFISCRKTCLWGGIFLLYLQLAHILVKLALLLNLAIGLHLDQLCRWEEFLRTEIQRVRVIRVAAHWRIRAGGDRFDAVRATQTLNDNCHGGISFVTLALDPQYPLRLALLSLIKQRDPPPALKSTECAFLKI